MVPGVSLDDRADVMHNVFGNGYFEVMQIPLLAGIAVGLPVMLAGSRLVQKKLFGVKGSDPLSLSAAVLLLVLAGLLAGYLPAAGLHESIR